MMTNEEIKAFISGIQPSATYDETGEWLNIHVDASQWKPFAKAMGANKSMATIITTKGARLKRNLSAPSGVNPSFKISFSVSAEV
jgi:hypothetical protein